jgi:hypothetical protein
MKTVISFALVMLCAASALAERNDWVIVPGKRLGPITSNTTRADLNRLFGNANVRDLPVDTGEGPEQATVVFPKNPSAGVAIFWQDNRIDRAMVCYRHKTGQCNWHTENGVSIGTSLRQLESLNGRPFQMEAWGSDVGGNITSWQRGNLAAVFGEGERNQLRLGMIWQEPQRGPTLEQRTLEDKINGQKRSPLSSDLTVRRLHPAVARMMLIFPEHTIKHGGDF